MYKHKRGCRCYECLFREERNQVGRLWTGQRTPNGPNIRNGMWVGDVYYDDWGFSGNRSGLGVSE